jgi:hypothetical protein
VDDLIAQINEKLDETERIASFALRFRKQYLEGGHLETWVARRHVNNETPPYHDYWAVEAHLGAVKPKLVLRFDDIAAELDARHFAVNGVPTVLRQVAAHRKILNEHQPYGDRLRMAWGEITACGTCGSVDDSPTEWPCPTVLALAEAYGIEP